MKTILICAIMVTLGGMLVASDSNNDTAQEILALERHAMDGWLTGNPDPMLATLDPEVTYFHDPIDKRLDGLAAVKALFDPYRGRPLFDSYEILDPKIQLNGDMAVMTYQLLTRNGSATSRWNSTEVYQHKKEGWRVIHAHWSKVNS